NASPAVSPSVPPLSLMKRRAWRARTRRKTECFLKAESRSAKQVVGHGPNERPRALVGRLPGIAAHDCDRHAVELAHHELGRAGELVQVRDLCDDELAAGGIELSPVVA